MVVSGYSKFLVTWVRREQRLSNSVLDEYDASEDRWIYYKSRYYEMNIQLNDIRYDKNGRGKWKFKSVDLSGDCFFNFNDKKITAFKKISSDEDLIERLNKCALRHHSNENSVLMPATGGMNNVKGKIYYADNGFVVAGKGRHSSRAYDRPDTFLWYLAEFYYQRKCTFDLLSAGEYLYNSVFKEALQSFNYSSLYQFLDSFKDIYEYCKLFYGIEKDFVDRMIYEGKMPILTSADLNRYIDLAEKFWDVQVAKYMERK